jgi:hypothetical protein
MTFTKDNAALDGFNQWRINGTAFSMEKKEPLFTLRHGALSAPPAQRHG